MSLWREAGLERTITRLIPLTEDLCDLIFLFLQTASVQQQKDLVMMLWALWKCRNEKVWNNEDVDDKGAVMRARQVLLDWELARQRSSNVSSVRQQPRQDLWKKPHPGWLKCNIDAAIFSDQQKYEIGMCLRNHLGEFVCAKTMVFDGVIQAIEAEATGLWEALSWIGSFCFPNVIFETDCKSVVDNILGDTSCHTELGVIISVCKEKLRQFQNYSVSFTRRQANSFAHSLARVSKFYARHQLYDYMPSCIIDSVLKELE